jgi:hypothetical protein
MLKPIKPPGARLNKHFRPDQIPSADPRDGPQDTPIGGDQ